MAKGGLFSHFRKRVEEIRVASLTPEEIMSERLNAASLRVTKAHQQLQSLKLEWQTMDAKHVLSMCGFTLVIGKFSAGEPDHILEWWRSWVQRSHAAQTDFNESLSVWAGLKGTN
jgi:hypothetical protein